MPNQPTIYQNASNHLPYHPYKLHPTKPKYPSNYFSFALILY
nr:MAG TPA: hypothetical protein [Caudoviricetes sp.]